MLLKSFKAEQMKLKHSPVWLAFILLPVLSAFMGTFNYLQNTGILTDQWYSLWTQHTLFLCYFFLPPLLGVYCSYLCRLEHTNHNWNAIMTVPVPVFCLYFSKLASACLMALATQLWIGILFFISGKLSGLTAPVPSALSSWLLCGFAGEIVICALQLFLSLLIRSFAVPVGIALIGGVTGLGAMAKGYGVWFPYSLLCLGMRANRPGGPMQCRISEFVINILFFLALFTSLAMLFLKKSDVTAE